MSHASLARRGGVVVAAPFLPTPKPNSNLDGAGCHGCGLDGQSSAGVHGLRHFIVHVVRVGDYSDSHNQLFRQTFLQYLIDNSPRYHANQVGQLCIIQTVSPLPQVTHF